MAYPYIAASAGKSLAKIDKSIMNNSEFKVRDHCNPIIFTFLPIFKIFSIFRFFPKSCLGRRLIYT
jgi:hypothetical protein